MSFFSKIVLLVVFMSATLFANSVATVTGLNGKAFVDRDAKKTELNLGDKLQEKDIIRTQDEAKVQIIFKDETIISIGKNSTFAISEYLFEDNQEPVAKFGMLSGAMRAITGKIGKVAPDKFMVKTKTATMGIRGTNFSILVGEDGSYEAYCTFGAISVTIDGAEHVVQQGFYISISPDGKVEVKEFTPQDLKDMKEKNFAKSKAKKGNASEDGDATADNEGQLDTTVEEMDNIVIKDISDSVVDAEQTSEASSSNLADLIAGYSMSDAVYNGTYNITLNNGDLPPSGNVVLDVNFGADSLQLTLDPGQSDYQYSVNSVISETSFSVENGSGGTAIGTFSGATGNSVSGSFTGDFGGSGDGAGTYNATSSQTLH